MGFYKTVWTVYLNTYMNMNIKVFFYFFPRFSGPCKNGPKSPTKPKVEKEKNPEIDCEDPYGDLKKAEK